MRRLLSGLLGGLVILMLLKVRKGSLSLWCRAEKLEGGGLVMRRVR